MKIKDNVVEVNINYTTPLPIPYDESHKHHVVPIYMDHLFMLGYSETNYKGMLFTFIKNISTGKWDNVEAFFAPIHAEQLEVLLNGNTKVASTSVHYTKVFVDGCIKAYPKYIPEIIKQYGDFISTSKLHEIMLIDNLLRQSGLYLDYIDINGTETPIGEVSTDTLTEAKVVSFYQHFIIDREVHAIKTSFVKQLTPGNTNNEVWYMGIPVVIR